MILAIAVLLMQGNNQKLLGKVIPEWTGANGYEEYILAATAADDLGSQQYRYYARPPVGIQGTVAKPTWILNSPNHLEEDGMVARRYSEVYRLVRMGNDKQVVYPVKPITASTLFPELSVFRSIPVLFASSAYWHLGNGEEAQGGRDLSDALQFCLKQPDGLLLQYLVRNSMMRSMVKPILDQLSSFSQADCEKFAALFSQFIDSPSRIIDSYKSSELSMVMTANEVIAGREKLGAKDELLAKLSKQLSQEDVRQITQYFAAKQDSEEKPLFDLLSRPESEWGTPVAPGQSLDFVSMFPNASQAAIAYMEVIGPIFDQLGPEIPTPDTVSMYAHYRTQIRLMVLTLKVASFRWEFDRLPEKLTDAVDLESATDPLNGKLFVYRKVGETYEINSEGLKGKGRIDLNHGWKSAFEDRPDIAP